MAHDTNLTETARRLAGRARDTWLRLMEPVTAWRMQSEAGREEVCIADLSAAEPVRRWRAAAMLRRNPLASPEAVAALVAALADDEEFVHWHAVEALAAQESGRVFAVLQKALSDSNSRRRAGAAEALGRVGGESAVLALKRQVDDPAPMVRGAVAGRGPHHS
jgi:HEAT repeat protein